MRVIYLSTTKEKEDFGSKEKTVAFFRQFLEGKRTDFNFSSRKIDKKKFEIGEDILFLRPDKNYNGNWTYEIVAYCKSASGVIDQSNPSKVYPHYFDINTSTLKIFEEGIDVQVLNVFVHNEKLNGITKDNFFTDNIINNKFMGARSWPYFNKADSEKIVEKLKNIVFEKYNTFK